MVFNTEFNNDSELYFAVGTKDASFELLWLY